MVFTPNRKFTVDRASYSAFTPSHVDGPEFQKKLIAMARRDLFVVFWVRKDPYEIWARSHQAHASAWGCEFYYVSY